MFTLVNNASAASSIEIDKTITTPYKDEKNLLSDVAVITIIDSLDDLTKLKGEIKKANTAILTVDKNMNLVDNDDNSLNISLKDAYINYLKGQVIPAVYVKTQEIADAFINYSNDVLNLLDVFVVSNQPSLVEHVRKNIVHIRGIVDYSNKQISEIELASIVSETNKSYANVVILNKETATPYAVRYIQARFKTVWINNKDYNKCDIVHQISIGAYGIICNDYKMVYETFSLFDSKDSLSLTRVPYNVAHRGVFFDEAENTLEGFLKAYDLGATHLELDIRMTKDGKLVLMHDATIDRCVYYQKGNVSDYTLTELEEMLVRQNGFLQILPEEKWAPVPSLETIFKNFKGLDVVLVVEIKSEEDNLVSVLKELIDSYDILDQVVVITSKESQVEHMRDELPEVPTATLHTMSATDMSVGLERLARLNCSLDMHYGDVKGNDLFDDFVFNLAARGYSSWFWTYDYEKVIWDSIKAGVVGITNNSPDDIADYVVGFTANKYVPVDLNTYNGELELEVISYDKKVSKVVAKEVYSYEEDGNKYAYFVYTFDKGFKNKAYQIYSGRLMLVSQDIYVSVSDMETILSKEVSELTEEDINNLAKIKDMYEKLDAIDKSKIDLAKTEEILNSVNSNDNIIIVIVASVVIVVLGLMTMFVVLKNQKYSKRIKR